jgi:hypothetical protein
MSYERWATERALPRTALVTSLAVISVILPSVTAAERRRWSEYSARNEGALHVQHQAAAPTLTVTSHGELGHLRRWAEFAPKDLSEVVTYESASEAVTTRRQRMHHRDAISEAESGHLRVLELDSRLTG